MGVREHLDELLFALKDAGLHSEAYRSTKFSSANFFEQGLRKDAEFSVLDKDRDTLPGLPGWLVH